MENRKEADMSEKDRVRIAVEGIELDIQEGTFDKINKGGEVQDWIKGDIKIVLSALAAAQKEVSELRSENARLRECLESIKK